MKNFTAFLFLFLYATVSNALEYKHFGVEKLINSSEPPSGVVFEIITWDKDAWDWAAPMMKQYRQQLLEKYPDLDIALVSHGGEQFELVKAKKQEHKLAFKTLQILSDQGVSMHVCGTHSSWRDVPEDDYIDIFDVSPSGPAQINDYINLGYTHLLLQAPY